VNAKLESLLPRRIVATLAAVAAAERVIEEELAACAIDAPSLSDVFQVVAPTRHMLELVPEVYASHARELVRRMMRGEDVALGTKAEVMLACSIASLRAPLVSLDAGLYEELFIEIMGAAAAARCEVTLRPEPWTGARAERLAELRRATRVPARRPG